MKRRTVMFLVCLLIVIAYVTPPFFSTIAQASNIQEETAYYDIVINYGRVIDPISGYDGLANVGIKTGKIIAIVPAGQKLNGSKEIDATGLVVAPGFINIHGHGRGRGTDGEFHVRDGITTEIAGNCGDSGYINDPKHSFAEFAAMAEKEGLLINIATYIGHNTLREMVGVPSYRTPATPEQTAKMVAMLRQDMKDGALGVSFGPFYGPGCTYEEMLALAKVAAEYGGCASSHVRDAYTPGGAVESVNEAINTAREAKIPFIISHTGGGPTVVPRSSGPVLEAIYEARQQGLKLGMDLYGYEAQLTYLGAAIFDYPLELLALIMEVKISDLSVANTVIIDGKEVIKAGERFSSIDQFNFVRNKVKKGEIPDPWEVGYLYKPAKLSFWMSNPLVMIENDNFIEIDEVTGKYYGHPAGSGAFAHFLGYWVREQGVCDLRTALARTSSDAASFLGLDKKGRVQVGCDADLTIFDAGRIIDKSTYTDPGQPSAGIPYVIVNGVVAVDNGNLTDAKSGQVIRRNWTVPGDYPNLGNQPAISVEALNP